MLSCSSALLLSYRYIYRYRYRCRCRYNYRYKYKYRYSQPRIKCRFLYRILKAYPYIVLFEAHSNPLAYRHGAHCASSSVVEHGYH